MKAELAEFRRWLIVAILLAVCSAVAVYANAVFLKSRVPLNGPITMALWTAYYAGEAWVQFEGWRWRLAWTGCGLCVGLALAIVGWQKEIVCLAGVVEFAVASKQRRRPWIWLIVTPLIYGTMGWWLPCLLSAVNHVGEWWAQAQGQFFVGNTLAPFWASLSLAILITRAVAGSFLASRKVAVH
jgi:hypothetical protein